MIYIYVQYHTYAPLAVYQSNITQLNKVQILLNISKVACEQKFFFAMFVGFIPVLLSVI